MNQDELITILNELRSLPVETEWFEFKEAKNSYDFNKIGRYFSALSNEANLKNKPFGWLIFGVRDSDRKIVGSNFRRDQVKLESLKKEIANQTTSNLTFLDIFPLDLPDGRVVMFQIPAAPRGVPIAWKGHFYGRDGESLGPLNIAELDLIRKQTEPDWSTGICEEATLDDLDPQAIVFARKKFSDKYKSLADEVIQWSTFKSMDKRVEKRLTIF